MADEDGDGTVTVPAPAPAEDGSGCTTPDACTIALMAPRDDVEGDPLISAARPVPIRYAPP